MTFFLLILGLACLLVGGATLVRGASMLASQYGVSPLLVGLTVVAFGTSAPELVVNIIGTLRNQSDLAFGNVVGSNLANLGLVLSTAALVKPMKIEGQIVRRELPLLLLGTSVLLVMTLDRWLRVGVPEISRSDALILLLLLCAFLYIAIAEVRTRTQDAFISEVDEIRKVLPAPKENSTHKDWLFVIIGSVLLGVGGHLTVDKGSEFAQLMGLPPVVVGMLVVAIGTSLPELVTSVIAAIKNESDLCLGNVVGSNLFNSLFVLPAAALIKPISIPSGGIVDILLTLGFSAALVLVFLFDRGTLHRRTACAMLATYVGYMWLRTVG
ncbi:MAG: calcium/sodium antiporter [Halioglobus sp.]|nr:calcium/sodium antiporter [Halioglobus sp.]